MVRKFHLVNRRPPLRAATLAHVRIVPVNPLQLAPTAHPDAVPAAEPALTVAVMGAGGVGCYYGGLLARAGHRVTLIGRASHVQAVQARGLRLQTASSDTLVPVAASTEPSAAAGAGLLLVAVKSGDTEAAAAALAPHLQPGALLLSLQNGVDNAERLRTALQPPPGHPVQAQPEVAAAAVYVAVEMAGPGHVRHHGRGELLLQRSPGTAALQPVLQAAGIPCSLSDEVRGALWAKLLINCCYNALSALGALTYGPLMQREGVAALMQDLLAEGQAVAQAEGVALPPGLAQAVWEIARSMPGQMSSTAQDLLRGRRSEIDHLNGHLVRRGQALGVPTPANRALWVAVKLAEARA